MKTLSSLGLALCLVTGSAGAQEPLYDSQGRRDPFLSPSGAAERRSCPGRGLSGRLVEEIALRGFVRTVEGRTALLATSDGQTYFASEGARLCDGHVLRIDADAVVFVQRLSDPLGPEREMQVRRPLHPDR